MGEARTYLDHNATAPLRSEARAAMLAALDLVGNASSVHAEGRRARETIEVAREQVAAMVGAKPEEVVFTSGATEANNWVIRGGWDGLAIAAHEHDSVLAPAKMCGAKLTLLPVKGDGVVDLEALRELVGQDVTGRSLFSLQYANSETGVLQPVAEVVGLVGANRRVHCDAVQAVGRVPVDFRGIGLDFMSISGHKLGGPKGIGALVVRDGIDLSPLLAGGGQERRRRSGTENVAAIAGFGAAATAALAGLGEMARVSGLRGRLEEGVRSTTPKALVIGSESPRLPNTSCIAMPGADASTLLIQLDMAGIAVSAGSACSSGKIGGSHVLAAMGIGSELARGAIRVSLGVTTTEQDVERFIAAWDRIQGPRNKRIGNEIATANSALALAGADGMAGE